MTAITTAGRSVSPPIADSTASSTRSSGSCRLFPQMEVPFLWYVVHP